MKTVVLFLLGLIIIVFISRTEGSGGYSYADCTYVPGGYSSSTYGGRCFCYTSAGIKWHDFWSTFQVNVTSSDDVFVVYPMESRFCCDAGNLITRAACVTERFLPSVQKEKSLDIPLVGEEVFFLTKSPKASVKYTLHIAKQKFNMMRFFIFACGLALFFLAGAVCRSSLFFYISGVLLGMVSIVVFLLLALRRFLPSRGFFLVLLSSGVGLSFLAIQKLVKERDVVMTQYWREVMGYLLMSVLISLTVCYKLGPITNKRTLGLLTWALQAVAIVLACHGVTYAPVSWMLLVALLSIKITPVAYDVLLGIWRQTFWLLSMFLGLFRRRRYPKTKLLTEEEYREQGERQTKASLEELRKYCNSPGFPAWDTVLRLKSPQRFAEFLHSGSHITASELCDHEQRYRPGTWCDEDAIVGSEHATATATAEDFSEDELCSYSRKPPSLSHLSFLPAVPTPIALPPPPGFSSAVCPYTPALYTPVAKPLLTEDDDDPF